MGHDHRTCSRKNPGASDDGTDKVVEHLRDICFLWTRAVSQHSPVPEEHVGPSKPGERYLDTHRT